MKRLTGALYFLVTIFLLPPAVTAQLPADIHPDSRSRLEFITGAPEGAAGIRRHGSQGNTRWQSSAGRALTELAILTSAREHDQPYEWSLHEMEGIAVGLDPAVIDIVRNRKPLAGVGDKESAIIQTGREVFRTHKLSSETYARTVKALGERDLVDIVDLMANYAGTAARLTAFNQQMPPGWKQFLPLPFTPPDDIHPDSRSRLPLAQTPAPAQATPPALYSRNIAPEGTGPGAIRRHGAGLKSLEASVGRRTMELAILVTAREHDDQYQWTMNEPIALRNGLEPAVIDLVRNRKSVTELAEKDAVLIEFARQLFRNHTVNYDTYARALKAFGERDLVDIVDLMAQRTSDGVLLIAFNQLIPAGQSPLLPIP